MSSSSGTGPCTWVGLLVEACRQAGAGRGFRVGVPTDSSPCSADNPFEAIQAVAAASAFFPRRVTLDGDWYRRDGGSLVGFLGGDRTPVALLFRSGRYRLLDPRGGPPRRLDPGSAAEILPEAFSLYAGLPGEPVSAARLVRFILAGNGGEIRAIAGAGFGAALLGFAFPLMLGRMIDGIIPSASLPGVGETALGLLVAVLAMGLFTATRSFALVRFEGRMDATVQAAIWQRLLSLPMGFFARYTAGDLAFRSMGINAIRNILTGLTINSLLALVFSSVNALLLLVLDWRLAAAGLALLGVQACAVLPMMRGLVRHQTRMYQQQGRNAGEILQLLTGVLKLRMAAAEERAYRVWSWSYFRQKREEYRAGRIDAALAALNAFLPVASAMLLFALVIWLPRASLSTGRFLAFLAAFGGLEAALVQMTLVLSTTLDVVPIYRRLSPILEAVPENPAGKSDPGTLTGRIELRGVSFAYRPGDADVLHEVSLETAPGEFVAITGPSGSGKSTLLRLLLGFEKPRTGCVCYDGMELGSLDVHRVRRQIGTVIQQGRLMGGELYRCILGARATDMDAAWEAARAAGLEEEIKALPMGMFTVVPPGGGTFSGGQCQRIMIAQALVGKPSILFLDEATSSLDNRSQEIVTESIAALGAMRLVIAHRLSTIRRADRILVMEGGRIVETGTFDGLMAAGGPFFRLAQRQMI